MGRKKISQKKSSKSSKRVEQRKYIIGLDLGTRSGYAVFCAGKLVESGTWDNSVKTKRKRNPEMLGERWIKFSSRLDDLLRKYKKLGRVTKVGYEMVYRHIGTVAAHRFGAWLALLEIANVTHKSVPFQPVSIGTWKKSLCGSGSADKELYVESANEMFGLELTVKKNEDEAAAIGVAYSIT